MSEQPMNEPVEGEPDQDPASARQSPQAGDIVSRTGVDPAQDRVMADVWETVKRLPRYIKLATLLARDSRVPKSSKAFLIVGSAYAVSPIDLVPGVIPVAGQLDDLYVILTALQQAIRACPDEIVEEHLAATGITVAGIDADLANVRKMVRRGVAWTLRNGGKALLGATKYASSMIGKQRRKGGLTHDEKPL